MTELTAPWIWFDAGRDTNVFARARKILELDAIPETASFRITCSGHYRLWINGEPAALHGSFTVHEETVFQKRTETDITGFVRFGADNSIESSARHYTLQ